MISTRWSLRSYTFYTTLLEQYSSRTSEIYLIGTIFLKNILDINKILNSIVHLLIKSNTLFAFSITLGVFKSNF